MAAVRNVFTAKKVIKPTVKVVSGKYVVFCRYLETPMMVYQTKDYNDAREFALNAIKLLAIMYECSYEEITEYNKEEIKIGCKVSYRLTGDYSPECIYTVIKVG